MWKETNLTTPIRGQLLDKFFKQDARQNHGPKDIKNLKTYLIAHTTGRRNGYIN